jgi:glycosyltransferase involved in cell wall biosynthesis
MIGLASRDHVTVPVSVVIPCFNCAKTLGRAFSSVLEQTNFPAEILLVDDASDDNTRHLIKSFEKSHPGLVKGFFFDSNQGPSACRNFAWDNARYEYVAFLDSDDAWHPKKLELQIAWMLQNPYQPLVGHVCLEYTEGLEFFDKGAFRVCQYSVLDMVFSNRFSTPSILVRRDISERFPEHMRYAEDYCLWLLICSRYKSLHKIDFPLAWYFKQPYGASGLSSRLWAMELGELSAFRVVWKNGGISTFVMIIGSCFSLLKFVRRFVYVNSRIYFYDIFHVRRE